MMTCSKRYIFTTRLFSIANKLFRKIFRYSKIFKEFIEYENTGKQSVNFSKLKGVKSEGVVNRTLSSNLEKITWIDQSVTGMFEKRTTYEDLTRGL